MIKIIKTTKYFVTKKILSQFVNLNEIEQNDTNFKSQLIEWSQKNKKEIKFETTEEINEKTKQPKFIAVVEIENTEVGKGHRTSKKEAQQNAARQTLAKLDDFKFLHKITFNIIKFALLVIFAP